MKTNIRVQSDGTILINDLKDYVNIELVEYYSAVEKDGSLHLSFYDKDKNVITPKVQEEGEHSLPKDR